ncbi:MAG: hypothetical protein IOC90_11275 [Methylocystis sp.]|jgi:hypothetical protein|nr:hypothetical protein [Methylocystis sp.]MCA3584569.1 hypothetical protein [Methylocystis sp.]MCA3588599.1 hypothetical protein [Methylocystis sp.]MCA3591332.1 hypothetical protein [Methylocystis sp.]
MAAGLLAGCVFFGLVFGLGFALGTIRETFVGQGAWRGLYILAETLALIAYGWWAAGWCIRRFAVPARIGIRLAMGFVMFALLRTAEGAVGSGLMGLSLADQASRLISLQGLLEIAPQALVALFPALRAQFIEPRQTCR